MPLKIASMNSLVNLLKTNCSFRTLTTSSALMKAEDRKLMLASLPARDEGMLPVRISSNFAKNIFLCVVKERLAKKR